MILTASGGPFRTLHAGTACPSVPWPRPWPIRPGTMGPKITVDSATLMNKALEIIEARWLFDLSADQIAVVIHPQSIVHSMVEYRDGSVIAQLSPPDMKLPIQYALTWPERREGVAAKLDWSRAMELQFEPPDFERFGALAAGAGGRRGRAARPARSSTAPTRPPWPRSSTAGSASAEIVPACRSVLQNHNFDPNPSLEQVLEADRWARQEVLRCCCT